MLFHLCLGTSNLVGQSWTETSPPVDHPWGALYKVHLAADESIFAVFQGNIPPYGARFYRSIDEGASWDTLSIPVDTSFATPAITDVFAFDQNRMWSSVINLRETMDPPFFQELDRVGTYYSEDGGTTWEERGPAIDSLNEVIEEIHFYSPDTGLVFTSATGASKPLKDQIFRTVDGGLNWTAVGPALDSFESKVIIGEHSHAYLGDTIWTGTGNGRIMRSTDRGQTWDVFETGFGVNQNVNSVAFQDHQNGIAVMGVFPFTTNPPGTIIRTTDGGATWTQIDGPERIELISHVPGSGGVYIGQVGSRLSPGYYLSKDGGDTWIRSEELAFFVPIVFTSPTQGYSSGNALEFLINFTGYPHYPKLTFKKYVGEPLTFDPDYADQLLFIPQAVDALPENYRIFSIDVVDENTIWAVAFDASVGNMVPVDHQSLVLKTTDGGDNWESYAIEGAPGRVSFDIHAFDANTAWVTTQDNGNGQGRGLFKTEDGGQTWTEKYNHISGGVWLHFFDDQEGVAINRNSMSRTIDGGETWDTIAAANFPPFNEDDLTIIGSGSNTLANVDDHLWFGTNNGLVYHSADRGRNWTADSTLAGVSVRTIAFKDTLNGLALSPYFFNSGFNVPIDVLRTVDGGQTWENLNDGPSAFQYYDLTNLAYVPNTANTYVATSNFWDNLAMYTLDGGVTWAVFPDVVPFGAIDFLNATTGWIARGSGAPAVASSAIYKYNGDLFTELVSNQNQYSMIPTVKVFPNPVVEDLHIAVPEAAQNERLLMMLADINGRILKQTVRPHANSQEILSVADLAPGQYFLRLHGTRSSYQASFVKP